MIHSNVIEMLINLLYCSIVIPLGIMINKKLYQNVKNEEHLEKGKIIQRIMKTHSLTQCITWPILISAAFVMRMNKNILRIISPAHVGLIISVGRSANTLNSCYCGFNSLIIAISRYSCIVYDVTVERIGVKRMRRLLISSSIGFPIFIAILNEALIPIEDVWVALFMPNYKYSYDKNRYHNETVINSSNEHVVQSPIFLIADSLLPSSLKSGLRVVRFLMLFLIYSNLLEGIMYFHTFIYSYRYVDLQIFNTKDQGLIGFTIFDF